MVASRTQCNSFSIPQWSRLAASRRGGFARFGLALVTAQAVSSHLSCPVFASCTTLSMRTIAATWGNSTNPDGVGATRIVRVSMRPWPLPALARFAVRLEVGVFGSADELVVQARLVFFHEQEERRSRRVFR